MRNQIPPKKNQVTQNKATEIMAKIYPNLMKMMNPQMKYVERIPSTMNIDKNHTNVNHTQFARNQ